LSVGTLTTAKFDEKTKVFENLNDKAREVSTLMPLSNYYGQVPGSNKDPYDRRKVK
jgi:hypothetical protein